MKREEITMFVLMPLKPNLVLTHEVFYGTQYHPVPPVEKDSYVIEKDLYVRI
jgi:hypothetical protein